MHVVLSVSMPPTTPATSPALRESVFRIVTYYPKIEGAKKALAEMKQKDCGSSDDDINKEVENCNHFAQVKDCVICTGYV